MLDALAPAAEAAKAAAAEIGATRVSTLAAAALAAREGATATCGMSANAGRSSYVNADVLKNVPDPGAMAVAGWLGALADAIAR
eukprot:scaffold240856_cov27-Tisochrysis_lutea.AAC.1